jgi:hypothetical protein
MFSIHGVFGTMDLVRYLIITICLIERERLCILRRVVPLYPHASGCIQGSILRITLSFSRPSLHL